MKKLTANFKTKKMLAFFMALVMALTAFPLYAFATVESGTNAGAHGTVEGNPFTPGEPSQMFRIPNLVTLDDGTLVAQADARWNGGMDGGGNDSMVAVSTNNGATWDWQMLTYYPDNGDVFDPSSTSICDSALATDGKNVYSLSTFFPAGVALNSSSANNRPVSDKAFDSQGRLLLQRSGESGYNYYLGAFESDDASARAQIYQSNGTPVSGYTVDHDFYLYDNGSKTNETLFYSDCEFQTVKTTFLVFRTSADGGRTWSPMKLLNVKNSGEQFYGVGPGRGAALPDGTIIFGCYSWNGSESSQASSFIYSKDGGQTWQRMENVPQLMFWLPYGRWSSECQPVILDDGTVRLFMRNARPRINYIDAVWNGERYVWNGDPVSLDLDVYGEDFTITENNQYSVIPYSKQVLYNGNYYKVLIVSHANGGGTSRSNGTLTFLLMDSNNQFVAATQTQLWTGFFGYSCLTEMPGGQVAILFENVEDPATITFSIIDDLEATSGFTIPDLARTYNVAMIKNDQQTFSVSTKEFTNTNPAVASPQFEVNYSSTANTGTDSSFSGQPVMLTDALYTFTQTSNNMWYIASQGVYLTIGEDNQPSTKDRAPVKVLNPENGFFQFVDELNEALYMYRSGGNIGMFDQTTAYDAELGENSGGAPDADREGTLFRLFRPTNPGEQSGEYDPVPGYKEVDRVVDGGKYLIGCDIGGSFYFLYPSYQPDNVYTHTVKGNADYVDDGFDMIVTAHQAGTTTIAVGLDTYNIEVSDFSREISGVVSYDPVIYTHGGHAGAQTSNIVSYGSNISDGNETGEKITNYTVRDNFTIIGIDAVNSATNAPMTDASITPVPNEGNTGGHLSGILPLADDGSFSSVESGEYVTLKTTLREESTGLIWTQTDRLYVASNPVPGHVVVGARAYTDNWFSGDTNLPFATYLLAQGSLGNTSLSYGFGNTGAYVGNALWLSPQDGVMSFDGDKESSDALNSIFDYLDDHTEFKSGGVLAFSWNGGEDIEQKLLPDNLLNNTTIAYYYYDKSSDKNEGIIPGSDSNHFSIQVSREPVDTEYGGDEHWDRSFVINDQWVTSPRQYVDKLSGDGTIERQEYMFYPEGSYDLAAHGDQQGFIAQERTATINCTTNVQPNSQATLQGVVSHQEGAEGTNNVWNEIRLTFEIRMCDKTNERTPYDQSVASVEKSTWYTTTSWNNYMNALLIRQEYLNDYTLLTTSAERDYTAQEGDTYADYFTYNGEDTIDVAYRYLEPRADFDQLQQAIEDSTPAYDNGIVLENGNNYTPDSYEALINAYENAQEIFTEPDYDTEDERNDTPGYVMTPDLGNTSAIMGPGVVDIIQSADHTDEEKDAYRLDVQERIDNLTDALRGALNGLAPAADDDVYVAAKDESEKIDMTAYEDNGAEIGQTIDTGDQAIYRVYDGVNYVNLPATAEGQGTLDGHTKSLLEDMNINTESEHGNLKQFHVDYTLDLDGSSQSVQTVEGKADYYYGETAHIDLTQYASDQYTVKMTVTSETGGKDATTYNAADFGYVIPILIQEDTEIKVEVYTNAVLTVKDYYGTVIGTAYIDPVDGTQVDVYGDAIRIGDVTVATVKENPKYTFTGWSVADGSYQLTEATEISQYGSLNAGETHTFTVLSDAGTVNNRNSFATPYFNEKLNFEAPEGSVWTRVVGGQIYLASYDANFVNFSSNESVDYRAYSQSELSSLPAEIAQQITEDIPAVYGTGYFQNKKFTLSCDYSAPDGVTVLEAGIICSRTDDVSTDETLRKGQEGAYTVPANRIAHWNNNSTSSGTYTMTLNNSASGTYYMRAYVSYAKDYISDGEPGSISVPYVEYCERIFKCENGVVTAVN